MWPNKVYMKMQQSSLAGKIALYILAIVFFITALGSILEVYLEYTHDRSELEESVHSIHNSLEKTLSHSLWITDDTLVKTIMAGILAVKHIEAVTIVKEDGSLLQLGEATSEKSLIHKHHITRKYRGTEVALAHITVTASLKRIVERIHERVLLNIGLLTFWSIFLALSVMAIFYFQVGRHLLKMSRFAKDISLENLDTPLVLHRKNNSNNDNDEISTLSAAINTMRYQLQTSLASLKSREHKYRSILQTALDGFWITDNHGKFLEVNDAYAKMSGYTKDELLHMQATDVGHTIGFEKFLATSQHDVLTNGTFETTHRKKDNTLFHVEINLRHLPLDEGIFVVFIRDITLRKHAEEETARQKLLFETMFNTIPDGVVITDTNRTIQLANAGMQTTFGYAPKEIIGQKTAILYAEHDHYHEAANAVFQQGAEQRQGFYVTYYKNKKGKEFPAETFGARLFDGNNLWIGNLGIMRDITERAEAEKLVQHIQKMESIGTLAGGIAHDFNNLLSPIIGMAELLAEDLRPGSQQHANALQIMKAGTRGADLVRQILTFSRQHEHTLQAIELQPIIKDALKLSRAAIPSSITIEQNIDADCGLIHGDPNQIHQVIMNIITNASHAITSDNGIIRVALREVSSTAADLPSALKEQGKYSMLTISDSGIGMPADLKAKIFDPYFTTKAKDKGTGLGLAVAYGIIKQHKGDITVSSTPGIGTTFSIYFPLLQSPAKSRPPAIAENLAGGNEHILLVDDEESIIALGVLMLERLGYEVTSYLKSPEALEAFTASPAKFDLIITDMAMPNLSGTQLARKIKETRTDIPIVLCTGFNEGINWDTIKSMGIDSLLTKPITKDEMARTVRKMLDGRQATLQQGAKKQ